MDQFYQEFSVDDILNEIKQKKTGNKTAITNADRLVEQILQEKGKQEKQISSSIPKRQPQPQPTSSAMPPKKEDVPPVAPPVIPPKKEVAPPPVEVRKVPSVQSIKQELLPDSELPPVMHRRERRFFAEMSEEQTEQPVEKTVPAELSEYPVDAIEEGNSYIQLRENRKKKIKDFVLYGKEEDVAETEAQVDEENDEDKVIEEFDSMEDAPTILADLKELTTTITMRFALLTVIALVNLYVILANTFSFLPFPPALRVSENPMFYLLSSFLLLVVATVISQTTVVGGLLNLFKMKADGDSLPALTALISLAQCAILLLSPQSVGTNGVHLYSFVALLGLLFNCIGKLLIVRRTMLNFKYVTADCDKYVTSIIEDESLANDLTKGILTNLPVTVTNRKTGFLTGFLDMSFCEDIYDGICKRLVPIVAIASVVLAIGNFVITKDIYAAFFALTAVFAVCLSMFGIFAVNLPLLNAVKLVHKHGGMIIGYPAAEEFCDINTATAQGSDLFPAGSVILHGIKTFKGGRIDDAILDAASILVKADSILSDIFMQVIQGKPELLKEVDTIVYEDAMGISGWVDNKRVLIGSRELMLNHGIDVPSKDYENRYCGEDNSIVYLSNSGELTAVFIVSLHAEETVAASLEKLQKNDVFLIVKTVDSILTREKLAEVFEVESTLFRVIPSRLHKAYDSVHAPCEKEEGIVANNGNFYAYIKTLLTAKRLKKKIMFGLIASLASIIIGFLIVTVFCLMSNMSQLSPLFLAIYHLVWFAVAWLFQKFCTLS